MPCICSIHQWQKVAMWYVVACDFINHILSASFVFDILSPPPPSTPLNLILGSNLWCPLFSPLPDHSWSLLASLMPAVGWVAARELPAGSNGTSSVPFSCTLGLCAYTVLPFWRYHSWLLANALFWRLFSLPSQPHPKCICFMLDSSFFSFSPFY